MDLDHEQRRSLIALACAVAWADGVVEEAERVFVHDLVRRIGGLDMDSEEIDRWLREGPPPTQLSTLPKEIGEMFFYDAMRLSEADGDLADEELEALEQIMSRVFCNHPEGVELAKIKLIKRPG